MSNGAPSMEVPNAPEIPEQGMDLSSVEADRRAYEQSVEREDAILHAEAGTELEAAQATHAGSAAAQAASISNQPEKDEIIIEVEKILEDGIGPFYASLPDEAKPVFKKRGEQVASQIAEMVRSMNFRVRKAVRLIADWLRTIPGINKFFLEQEAKIKTDMLKRLIEARKDDEPHSL
jgi:hypothetical protein